jgi:hypothetical protein
VAIGAAVRNMRIAAAALGVLGDVDLSPDGSATFELGTRSDPELAAMYLPMLRRVTNRRLGDRAPADLAPLAAAARAAGADLSALTGGEHLAEAADLLIDADRIRYLVPTLHREMMSELCDPRTDSLERGIDVRTLEMGPNIALLGIARRGEVMAELADWDLGRALGGRVGELVESSSALVAVTVAGGGPLDYLRGGEATEAVWIAATAAGLAVQPIVPLFLFTQNHRELQAIAGRYTDRLAEAGKRLWDLLKVEPGRNPAMLLRISHAPAPTAISLRDPETAHL